MHDRTTEGSPLLTVGQFVLLKDPNHWRLPDWPGQVVKVDESPYAALDVGVRWRGWTGGHNLYLSVSDGIDGGEYWWCNEEWFEVLTQEEAVLWLLAR